MGERSKQLKDEVLLRKIVAKIKKLRLEKKVTLQAFYNDTNVHLSRIEYSKANISVSTLNTICKYFGLSLHEFFEDI
jgi:transcriptional regulator with XRE-family HTH domain